MQTLFSHFRRINLLPEPIKPHLSPFSSSVNNTKIHPHSSFLLNYLIQTFNFPQKRAQFLSNQYNHITSPEKPQSVLNFLQSLGFSETHICSSVRLTPQILFLDIDKILKPKIEFLQQLGLVGSHLGKFLSKNSSVLAVSLEKKLIPNIEILKKILVNNKNNEDLIKVITRCGWGLYIDPRSRLLSNIEYLESCGIVGSQLSALLKKHPRLFTTEERKLRELVSRTLSLGFSVNSRMFVHGLYTVSCLSEETVERKLQVFRSFGFSKDEFMDMFRKLPGFLLASEEKLKLGLEFFLYKMLMKREVLIRNPVCLTLSLEGRVIPRYKVLQIIKLKRLLEKEPNYLNVLMLTEKAFLDKFVLKFGDDGAELMLAYKGHTLDSSSCSTSEEKASEDK